MNIRLPMGASECALDKITAKGIFDKADPLGLDVAFQEVEAPMARPQTGKASGTSDKR